MFGFGTATDGQLVSARARTRAGGPAGPPPARRERRRHRPQGVDTDQNVLNPKVIEALLGTRFRGRAYGRSPVVAGSRNTLAIDADGQVLAWGWNARATLGNYRRANERKPRRVAGLQGVAVEQVAIGGWHCLAVDAEGNAWSWGECRGTPQPQQPQSPAWRQGPKPPACPPARPPRWQRVPAVR